MPMSECVEDKVGDACSALAATPTHMGKPEVEIIPKCTICPYLNSGKLGQ